MVHAVSPFGAQKWSLEEKGKKKIRRSLSLKGKIVMGTSCVLAVLVLTMVLVFVLGKRESHYWMPHHVSDSILGEFQKAAVSTDAAPCAAIGKDILQRNGSAVDAAIATLVCMGVVNPQSSGLGGGFFMLYYNRTEQKSYFVDAREVSPRLATEDMFGGNATLSRLGGLSIAVPSEVAGYSAAHARFGRLPWRDLFPPTVAMCREGITVSGHLANALAKYEKTVREFFHTRRIFVSDETGEILREGDVYARPDLAETLDLIARQNADALYGDTETAEAFFQDLKDAGSVIERADLKGYRARIVEPVRTGFRGDGGENLTLHSAPLPGSGPVLALVLHVLNTGFPDGGVALDVRATRVRRRAVAAVHRMVETFKFAYARRMYLEDDDSPEMKEFVKKMTSDDLADDIRGRIDETRTYDDPEHYGLGVTITEDHGTAHVSVVAENGDAVSATSTVNQYFGSHVVSPSTGILLNDEMDDFSLPSITNYFGVPPTKYNHIRPGKRPLSSMTPTIITDGGGDVRLVVGGNGGTQITTSVAEVIMRHFWLAEDVKQAIDAPRFHHQLLPNLIDHEKLFPKGILEDLKKLGHQTRELGKGMLGIIMAVSREEDGRLLANSDYRKGGTVDGY